MTPLKYSRERVQALADWGLPITETAARAECNRNSLAAAALRYGIKFTPAVCSRNKRVTDRQMRDAKGRGLTAQEAAEEYGVTKSYIYRRENECGLKLKRPPQPQSREVRPERPKAKPVTCATLMAQFAARENKAMRERCFNK